MCASAALHYSWDAAAAAAAEGCELCCRGGDTDSLRPVWQTSQEGH